MVLLAQLTIYVHAKSFELTKLFSVIEGQTRCSPAFAVSASRFSSLRDFQGHAFFTRANSPFPRKPNVFGILGALAKNAIFARAFGY